MSEALYFGALFFVGFAVGARVRAWYEATRLRAHESDRLSERCFDRLAAKVDADEQRRSRHD